MSSASRRLLVQGYHGWASCSRIGSCSPILVAPRRYATMKDSFPKLPPPRDPSKPSIARIVRNMDRSKTQEAEQPGGGDDTSDRRTFNRDLPDTYLPSAARGPAAPSQGPAPTPFGQGPGSGVHIPEGWDSFSGQAGLPGGTKTPTRAKRNKKITGERPTIELYGMRVVIGLLVCVAYLELKDMTWGPTGFTRKGKIITYIPDEGAQPKA
mmetsp:Transcript_59749/g.108994  ORF Transcript_59749/g.108994 Transcript_59749/m.108994 type:complete len:210 (+) Transcript_59749:106-735(+)